MAQTRMMVSWLSRCSGLHSLLCAGDQVWTEQFLGMEEATQGVKEHMGVSPPQASSRPYCFSLSKGKCLDSTI